MEILLRRFTSPEVVGRQRELTELGELLADASAGKPRLVLVGGDAGVGKSRLLEEFTSRAREDDARVLVGNCVDLGDSALPFAPVVQALRGLTSAVERSRVPELLGQARRELARILPELADSRPDAVDATHETARARLFAAIADVLRSLSADRTLLLALEDNHWADASTRDLLAYLARNLLDERILVVATFRTDELHRRHPFLEVVGELTRSPRVVRLDLPPLTRQDVADLLAGILGREPEPGLVEEITARAGGNAFYVEELVAAREEGSRQLPPALRDVVGSRLRDLPDPARRILQAAAVAGRTVDHRLLEAVADPGGDLVAALRAAVDHHVLVADDDGYRFRHDLVREVVEDDLLPGERTALHRRVAEVLERHPELAAGGADQVDAELAHHWYVARDSELALRASLRAAEQAVAAAAFAEALRHDERALELWDDVESSDAPDRNRQEVRLRAAESARGAGLYRRWVDHLRAALDTTVGDREEEADLRTRLVEALWNAGEGEAAALEARRCRDIVADAEPSPTRARALGIHARIHLVRNDFEVAVPAAREAVEAARAVSDRSTESHALNSLGAGLAITGSVDEGIERLRSALEIALEIEDASAVGRAYINLVVVLRSYGRREGELEAVFDEALAWLDAGGDRWAETAFLMAHMAYEFVLYGPWGRAEVLLDRMRRFHIEGVNRLKFHYVRAFLRWMQGRHDEARADASELRRAASIDFRVAFFGLEAEIAASDGRLADVRAAVNNAPPDEEAGLGAQLDRVRLLLPLARAEIDGALRADDGGRDEHLRRAEAAVGEMRRLVEHDDGVLLAPADLAVGLVGIAEAELSRATGHHPDLWRRAAARMPVLYRRLYARWRFAEALLAVGEREEAIAELEAAHAEAAELGARMLREGIEALARRARVILPGVAVTDVSDLGLTPREAEVLELLASGRTNREIGEALFITEKTASVHVSNILAKLEVDNRRHAALRAGELGLVKAP